MKRGPVSMSDWQLLGLAGAELFMAVMFIAFGDTAWGMTCAFTLAFLGGASAGTAYGMRVVR